MVNIHLQYLIQKEILKQECIDVVLWIFTKKKLMFFGSLGLDGFKCVIVDNDEKTIDGLLFDFQKCKINLTDQTLTLCKMKFSVDSWKNMTHTKKEQLTETAQNNFL